MFLSLPNICLPSLRLPLPFPSPPHLALRFMNCRVPASKRYQPTHYEHAANCATHGVSQTSGGHIPNKTIYFAPLSSRSLPRTACARCVSASLSAQRSLPETMKRIARNEAESAGFFFFGFLAVPQRRWALICDSACNVSLICCNPCTVLPVGESGREWMKADSER